MKPGKRTCALTIVVLTLFSCSSPSSFRNKVSVSVFDCAHVKIDENIKYAEWGTDVSFVLEIDNGFSFGGCSYDSYNVDYLGNDRIELSLSKVEGNLKVTLDIVENDATVNYYPNGGVLLNGGSFHSVSCSLKNHKRPNTINGLDLFSREGYLLVGWNTKEDGSGERIGLGSRVSVDSVTKKVDLYAMWVKQSDPSYFSYLGSANGLTISWYNGNEPEIVIPTSINGKRVIAIASNSFVNIHAKYIYISRFVTTIASNAFINCDFETFTFFDSLTKISDDSFVDCPNLRSLQINAHYPPVYVTDSRHSLYADKVDLLILGNKENLPRMVFEGDSGVWFNLHGHTVASYFADRYQIVNLGLNGFYNGVSQLHIACSLMKEGDQFVHVVATNSTYQILHDLEMTENMWTVLELNYDLFSYVDIREMRDVFSSYVSYMSVKLEMEAEDYEQGLDKQWVDEYGCIPFYMPKVNGDEDLLDAASIELENYDESTLARLGQYYDSLSEVTKRKPMYAFGAVNYDGLSEIERSEEFVNSFVTHVERGLEGRAIFVDHLNDNIFRGSNFYYTNFHLTTETGVYYTNRLCDHIEEKLK